MVIWDRFPNVHICLHDNLGLNQARPVYGGFAGVVLTMSDLELNEASRFTVYCAQSIFLPTRISIHIFVILKLRFYGIEIL